MIQERPEILKEMIEKAYDSLQYSYTPYSHFKVAAALLAKNGKIYTGCNIENASYGAVNCAERTAFFKAVSEGVHEFDAIVVLGGKDGVVEDYCAPCGICRQVMREFCDPNHFEIILPKSREEYKIFTLEQILPLSFGPENLLEE